MDKLRKDIFHNIKSLANFRKLELILIDGALLGIVYLAVSILNSYGASSLVIVGDFSPLKFTLLISIVFFFRIIFGIYRSIWRYANISTYLKLVIADTISGIIFLFLSRMNEGLYIGFAYSLITMLLELTITLVSRFVYQIIYSYSNMKQEEKKEDYDTEDIKSHKINIAIIGAGNVGATLAEELLRNPKSHYNPLCFFDNDKTKIGSSINGISVYSSDYRSVNMIRKMPIQELVIALPDADSAYISDIYEMYKQADLPIKIYDFKLDNGSGEEGEKRQLREFKIEDLLFRKSLKINNNVTRNFYFDKTVIITGGGGSIGSELCRQIAGLHPKKLVIVDIYENNAYEIQQELIQLYGFNLDLETYIASVRDEQRLDEIFSKVKPDIVFHAAAHKHVPLMENSGSEAIKNNVFGTYNTANMAEKHNVSKFVLISTDKAVNPTNIMGASKRLCEMVIQCRQDSKTEFCAVRFGNVLGSNGSVIPLFKKQIAKGGPITITDKRIIRYFMTIPEAVGLVMEAGSMAKNGELFVLDMGRPVRILDLAENMIKLSGFRPYIDIDIVEVGLRPGEKLFEELLMKSEILSRTSNKMIYIETDKPFKRNEIEEKLSILKEAALNANQSHYSKHHKIIIDAIKKTVPTYIEPVKANAVAEDSEEMNSVK